MRFFEIDLLGVYVALMSMMMVAIARHAQRRQQLTELTVTTEEKQTCASNAIVGQATYQQTVARLNQAHVNLQRTEIRSPVNGYVTNLLAQLGDYATVGTNIISLVDADSYWIDGYFEETNLEPIRVGDDVSIKPMGYRRVPPRLCRQHRPRH